MLFSPFLLVNAQENTKPEAQISPSNPKAVVLAPLFLDSLFNRGSYKYSNTIPKFAMQGLEFYNGAQVAADWLETEGISANIAIVDTRKYSRIDDVLAGGELQNANLLIGLAQNSTELRAMAQFAKNKHIPFISATYPNDGGLNNHPETIIINSTLKTHVEGVYSYLQSHHAGDNIIMVANKTGAGDLVKSYYMSSHQAAIKGKLIWKPLEMNLQSSPEALIAKLDSTRQNTIVVASLDEAFVQKLLLAVGAVSNTYACNVFGLPPWDNYKLNSKEYKAVDIYYSTAYGDETCNPDLYKALSRQYKIRANSQPSDMAVRGFENVYRFVKLSKKYPETDEFLNALNETTGMAISSFRFAEVPGLGEDKIQYRENKHVYMVHLLGGIKQELISGQKK